MCRLTLNSRGVKNNTRNQLYGLLQECRNNYWWTNAMVAIDDVTNAFLYSDDIMLFWESVLSLSNMSKGKMTKIPSVHLGQSVSCCHCHQRVISFLDKLKDMFATYCICSFCSSCCCCFVLSWSTAYLLQVNVMCLNIHRQFVKPALEKGKSECCPVLDSSQLLFAEFCTDKL